MRSNTIRRPWVDLLSKSKHVKISLAVGAYTIAQFICTIAYTTLLQKVTEMTESNQVCLWLPYVLNTTKSWLFFPTLLLAAWQWACDDVCSAVYRYCFCTNCTNMQCLLPALKGKGRFASILIDCAKTDGPITGNIAVSFCILLLANTAWPSYRRIARSISNKRSYRFVWSYLSSTPRMHGSSKDFVRESIFWSIRSLIASYHCWLFWDQEPV